MLKSISLFSCFVGLLIITSCGTLQKEMDGSLNLITADIKQQAETINEPSTFFNLKDDINIDEIELSFVRLPMKANIDSIGNDLMFMKEFGCIYKTKDIKKFAKIYRLLKSTKVKPIKATRSSPPWFYMSFKGEKITEVIVYQWPNETSGVSRFYGKINGEAVDFDFELYNKVESFFDEAASKNEPNELSCSQFAFYSYK